MNMKFPIILSKQAMMSLLTRVGELNNANVTNLVPFLFKGTKYGMLSHRFAGTLKKFPSEFDVSMEADTIVSVTLAGLLLDAPLSAKTQAIDDVMIALRDELGITDWRNEKLAVVDSYMGEPLFFLERSAYAWFGIRAYGIHVNGYVRDEHSSQISKMWIATRSMSKSAYPGMLDNMVAGAQPYDVRTPLDNVIKECQEEAGICPDISGLAICTGAISYISTEDTDQYKQDTMFCYDLEMSEDLIPTPADGEVDHFQLQPIDWVLDKVIQGGPNGFKPNCNLVLIDFFIRLVLSFICQTVFVTVMFMVMFVGTA